MFRKGQRQRRAVTAVGYNHPIGQRSKRTETHIITLDISEIQILRQRLRNRRLSTCRRARDEPDPSMLVLRFLFGGAILVAQVPVKGGVRVPVGHGCRCSADVDVDA